MRIQIHKDSEPLIPECDVLLVTEGNSLTIPVEQLSFLLNRTGDMKTFFIKKEENLIVKTGIILNNFFAGCESGSVKNVEVYCSDQTTLDAVCSIAYTDVENNIVACSPVSTSDRTVQDGKPQKKRTRKKSGNQQIPDGAASTKSVETNPVEEDKKPGNNTEKKADSKRLSAMAKAADILKNAGIPDHQIKSCIDAVLDASDPEITLPMQIRLHIIKDGGAKDVDSQAIALCIKPHFAEIKKFF